MGYRTPLGRMSVFGSILPPEKRRIYICWSLWGRSMNGPADVLNSWKEIAAYLRRGVRTVQRWERDLNLPVRRPRNRRRSAVIALRSDIDSWLANRVVTNGETSQLPAIRNIDERIEFLQRRLSELEAESNRIREELRLLQPKLGQGITVRRMKQRADRSL